MKAHSRILFLLLATVTYLLLGAAVFEWLESESESAELEALEEKVEELKRRYGLDEDGYREVETVARRSAAHRAGHRWKFTGSLYFAITVVSTIGKGGF